MKDLSMINGGFDRSGKTCLGLVTSIDSIGRTLRVKTMGTPGSTDDLDLPLVRILHGQTNGDGEEEVNIPRVGTLGLVIFIGSEPIWVGAIKMDMSNGIVQQTNQLQLLPGDWVAKTTGGNYFYAMVGGALQAVSTSQCRTYWLPGSNTMTSVMENYEVEPSGGTLHWTVDETSSDTTLALTVWDNVSAPENVLTLNVGAVPDDDSLMLNLAIGPISTDTNTPTQNNLSMKIGYDGSFNFDIGSGNFTFQVDKDGNITFQTKGNLTGTVSGDVNLTTDGKTSITSTGACDINTDADATVSAGGDVNVKAGGNAIVKASEIQLNGSDGQVLTTQTMQVIDSIFGEPSVGVETVTAG